MAKGLPWVPVVMIDHLGHLDRVKVRTELRRALFSAYEIENCVIAITGQIELVRQIAFRHATLTPRVRKVEMDGEELNQVHHEPGQFKDMVGAQKIARFMGLDRNHRRRLRDALKSAGFDAEVDSERGAVLAEYCGARKPEMDLVVAMALGFSDFSLSGETR